MAITKIHPIKRTLTRAVKYITNPAKTEEELYVFTFSCTRENLVQEFALTRKNADRETATLAQHLIQSFKKGEVDPVTAHNIGKELADRFTNGKHEYIIATHLDRGHIHNHIIFNHVDFIDYRCFHSDAKKLRELRLLNDEICKEHGLSVLERPARSGKSYYKWAMNKLGQPGKKKPDPSPDIIKKPYYIRVWKYDQSLGLIKNTGNYLLFIKSDYGRQRAAITDAKKLAATYNLLKENGIDSLAKLSETIKDSKSMFSESRQNIRNIESKISDINDTIKFAERAIKYRTVYDDYIKSGKSSAFYEIHRTELMLYESAKDILKAKGIDVNLLNISDLKNEREALEDARINATAHLDNIQKEYKDLLVAKKNVEMIMHDSEEVEVEKELTRKQFLE